MPDWLRSKTGANAHIAINADDIDVARSFYSAVLGWTFEPWGPPGFFHVRTSCGDEPGMMAALQARRDLGGRVRGFECTIAVEDAVHAGFPSAGCVLQIGAPCLVAGAMTLGQLLTVLVRAFETAQVRILPRPAPMTKNVMFGA